MIVCIYLYLCMLGADDMLYGGETSSGITWRNTSLLGLLDCLCTKILGMIS